MKFEVSDSVATDFIEAIKVWGVNAEAKTPDGYEYTIEGGSGKFVKGILKDPYTVDGGSVSFFIALSDGGNRTMGAWRKGDVFKSKSYKAPAPYARSNIYTDVEAKGMDRHGPVYLR